MHVLLCIVTGRYSARLYIAYAPLVSICITEEAIHDGKQEQYAFSTKIEECYIVDLLLNFVPPVLKF